MNNPHSDILKADVPESADLRVKMVEELKARAKGAFQAKDLLNAEMLYAKAIDCYEKDGKDLSNPEYLLYSNRAAVRLLLKNLEGALADCNICLELSPDFIKAHFRKAQALHRLNRWKDAVDACKAALEKHPGNKEIRSLQTEIEADREKDIEQKKDFKKEANEARPDLPEPTRVPFVAQKRTQTAETAGDGPKSSQSEFRGYKKTADGKTTSYFHTDISEEAKKLIGDCKPQKIEPDGIQPDGINGKTVGSAWNQAGTFEERNYTKWYHEKVRKLLPNGTNIELPSPFPEVTLTLESIHGDANVTCSRGKVKYIHDVSLDLKWRFVTKDDKRGEGSMKVEADGDGGYDVIVDVDSKTHSLTRSIVNDFVKSSAKGVQPFVLGKLLQVQEEFAQVLLN